MKILKILIILLVMIYVSGCHKSTEPVIPETQPPLARIELPVNNSEVNGVVTLKALAYDNKQIDKVFFYIDDYVDSVSTEPYEIEWDSKQVKNGTYSIICEAVDDAENVSIRDSVQVIVKNFLIEATIDNGWSGYDLTNYAIFVTDSLREVIGEATYSSGETVTVYLDDITASVPATFDVHILGGNNFDDDVTYNYYTYRNIKRGSHLRFKNTHPRYVTSEDITVNLNNFSGNYKWIASTGDYGNVLENATSTTLKRNYYQDNIYNIFEFDDTTRKYLAITDSVLSGNVVNIEYDSLKDATRKGVNFGRNLTDVKFMVYGVIERYSISDPAYLLDSIRIFDEQSFAYTYPASEFGKYLTVYEVTTTDTSDFYFRDVQLYGSPDDEFETLPSTLEIENSGSYTFEYTAGTENLVLSTVFEQQGNGGVIRWNVYCPSELTGTFRLPLIPDIVTDNQPDAEGIGGFEFTEARLTDYESVGGYDEFIDLMLINTSAFSDLSAGLKEIVIKEN